MAGMKFVGVDRRAADAKRALNRLHWEIDHAIERGTIAHADVYDLAEAVGIMSNILARLGASLPDEARDDVEALFGAKRDRFAQLVNYYTDYHGIPR